jgi:hypothetical protein
MTGTLTTPATSVWANARFGADSLVLQRLIPRALETAHCRAVDAHNAANMRSKRTYGTTLWELQHEELGQLVTMLPEGRSVELYGYQLAVIGRNALFPVRYHASAIDKISLPREASDQVRALFGLHGPRMQQFSFNDYLPGSMPTPAFNSFPQLENVRLITIAYSCSLDDGIQAMTWGEAALTETNHLQWHHHEELMPACW